MPLAALGKLCGVVVAGQLSLLLPEGFAIVAVPDGIDHAGLAGAVMDYAGHYSRARHPDSEAGTDIGPGEDAALNGRAAALRAVAK